MLQFTLFLRPVSYLRILKNAMTHVKRDKKGGFYFDDLIKILKSQIIGGAISIRKLKNGDIDININGEIIKLNAFGIIKEDYIPDINDNKTNKADIKISKQGNTLSFKNDDFRKTNLNNISHFYEMIKVTKRPTIYINTAGNMVNFNTKKPLALPSQIHVVMPGDTSLHSIILDISRNGNINVVDNGWCMFMARRAFIASNKKFDSEETFLRKFLPSLCDAINYAGQFTSKPLSYKDITFSRTSLDTNNITVEPKNTEIFPITSKGNCLWHSFTTLMNGSIRYKPYKIQQLDSSKLESSSVNLFTAYARLSSHYKGRINEESIDIDKKINQIDTSYAIGETKNNINYGQYKIDTRYNTYQPYKKGELYNNKLDNVKNYIETKESEKSYDSKVKNFESNISSIGRG